MTQQHPINPPPELFAEWLGKAMRQRDELNAKPGTVAAMVADRAAQWGADQELDAVMAELKALNLPEGYANRLRAARRPARASAPPVAQPEPQRLTVQECNDMRKHGANYIYESRDGKEIQLDGWFTREDLMELTNTQPTTH